MHGSLTGGVAAGDKLFVHGRISPWTVWLIGIEDRPCGVIHDFLFFDNTLPRVVCDALYYQIILAINVGDRRAGAIHTVLHLRNAGSYAKCTGGMKIEDLAFEWVPEAEWIAWTERLAQNRKMSFFNGLPMDSLV